MPGLESCSFKDGERRADSDSTEITEDVDELVGRLSNTLELGLTLKAQQKLKCRRDVRRETHPYDYQNNSFHDCKLKHCSSDSDIGLTRKHCPVLTKCHRSIKNKKYRKDYPSDPHQLLKYLLREGTLVKEAVNRLKQKQKCHLESADDTELRFR